MADSKFTAWQNSLTKVKIANSEGKIVEYEFRRIMIDYANALLETGSEKEAREAVGCNEYDAKNWISGYKGYEKYLLSRSAARVFSGSIDKDLIYGILGRAALGEIEINAAQVAALKLLMQGEGLISASGATKSKANGPGSNIESV